MLTLLLLGLAMSACVKCTTFYLQVLFWRRQQLRVAPQPNILLSSALPGRSAVERISFLISASVAALAFLLDHTVCDA